MGIDREHHHGTGRNPLGRGSLRQQRRRGEYLRWASAGIDPVFQFDTSGKLLKSFGAGMFTSPHKLTVDKDGNLWMADNGHIK